MPKIELNFMKIDKDLIGNNEGVFTLLNNIYRLEKTF